MLRDLGVAVALLLILEGVLPFLSPTWVRNLFLAMSRMHDTQLRFAGFTSMLLGVVLLYILR